MKITYSKIDGSIYEYIDEDKLDYIRQLPCCVSGCNNQSIPHHIQGKKLGRRDDLTINICNEIHHINSAKYGIHRMGKISWQKKFNIDIVDHAKKIHEEYLKESQI